MSYRIQIQALKLLSGPLHCITPVKDRETYRPDKVIMNIERQNEGYPVNYKDGSFKFGFRQAV